MAAPVLLVRMAGCAAGTYPVMEPIPETVEAFAEMRTVDGHALLTELRERASLVRALVPDCVGLSLASLAHGVTFTLVATDEEVAALDGIQYLFGGPCVDAEHTDEVMTFERGDAVLDERGWQQFARATAARSVSSTLSLPVLEGERVVGTVNLYAASAAAFAGLHSALAAIFDAWAPGAVTNADLSFSTREVAQQAPQVLRDDAVIHMAVGIIASGSDLSTDEARYALGEAARRAGISEVSLAKTVVRTISDYGNEV